MRESCTLRTQDHLLWELCPSPLLLLFLGSCPPALGGTGGGDTSGISEVHALPGHPAPTHCTITQSRWLLSVPPPPAFYAAHEAPSGFEGTLQAPQSWGHSFLWKRVIWTMFGSTPRPRGALQGKPPEHASVTKCDSTGAPTDCKSPGCLFGQIEQQLRAPSPAQQADPRLKSRPISL